MAEDHSKDLFQPTSDPAARDSSTIFPLEDRDIFEVPESELAALADTAPALHSLCGTRVARISRDLVIKKAPLTLPSEAEAMRIVAQKTSIRLPQVYRSFTIYGNGGIFDSTGYIVMSYVDGVCLSECWEKLLSDKRKSIIGQVIDIVQQLQSLYISTPGPIGGGPSQGKWFSIYGSGPFTDLQDFEDYFNKRLEMAKQTGNASPGTSSFKFSAFVMTHSDIAPRNLILDSDGRIHLIDWGYAGAYPPIFEAATIARGSDHEDFDNLVLQQLKYDQKALQQLMSIHGVLHFTDPTDFEKQEAWMKCRQETPIDKRIDPDPPLHTANS